MSPGRFRPEMGLPTMYGICKDVDEMSEAEAAAELLAQHLDSMGVVLDVGVDGTTVSFTTKDDGVHLGNVHADYDADVHLVCESDWHITSGPLAGHISDDAAVYVNVSVDGVVAEPEGYALPLFVTMRDGAVLNDEENVSDRVWALGEAAGLWLGE